MNETTPSVSMQSRIGLWGGSCAIRLPKIAVESLGLHEGEAVSLSLQDGGLILRPSKQRYSLTELVQEAKSLASPESMDDEAYGDEAL